MKKIFLAVFVFSINMVYSQSFQGLNFSTFDALTAQSYNPALGVGGHMKWQVGIIGFDVTAENDYLFMKGKIKDWVNGFDQDTHVGENLDGEDKDLSLGVTANAPSFMLRIKDKNTIGFFIKARGTMSVNGIDEDLATSLYNQQFDLLDWVDYVQDGKSSIGFTSWGEIGASYGRNVFSNEKHRLDVGVNVKLLTDGVVGKVDIEDVNFTVTADSIVNVHDSKFQFYGSNSFDALIDDEDNTQDVNFGIKSVGFDFGVVYAYTIPGKASPFLKAGLSVNDIGKLKYEASKYSRTFVGNGLNIPGQLLLDGNGDYKNLDSILDILGTRTNPTGTFKNSLPTVLNVFADIQPVKNFYVSVAGQINLLSQKKDNPSSNMPTLLSITPRYESKIFGAYLPMSYNKYGGFNMGAGVRVGQFSIGSNNFLTSLMKKQFKSINIWMSVGFGKSDMSKKRKSSEIVEEESIGG